MLLDSSVFEEPFEPIHLSKNDITPFEGVPMATHSNGLSNPLSIPLLGAPYSLLDNVDSTPISSQLRQPPLTTANSSTSATNEPEPTLSPEPSLPTPPFDLWLELQNSDRRSALPTSSNTWETFSLDAASIMKLKSKPRVASPFLSELSLSQFQSVEESYRQSTILRYIPENLIKHPQLIKDTVQLLLGTPSNLFEFNTAKKSFVSRIPNLRTIGVGSQSLNSLLNRFICIGNNMKKLDEYINACTYGLRSSVAMSFVDCLMDYHLYLQKSLLAMVEKLGGADKITILQLYYSVNDLSYVLEQLIDLCNMRENLDIPAPEQTESVSKPSFQLHIGPELLNLMYNKLESLDSAQAGPSRLLKSLIASLLATSSAPYFTLIFRWLGIPPNEHTGQRRQQHLLFDHSLHTIDPYQEFFVQATNDFQVSAAQERRRSMHLGMNRHRESSLSKSTNYDGDQYWHLSFQVDHSLRPCFISHELALDILETGKSLRLLKDLFPIDGPSLSDYVEPFINDIDGNAALPKWNFIMSTSGKATSEYVVNNQSPAIVKEPIIPVTANQCMSRSKHAGDDNLDLPSPKRLRHNTGKLPKICSAYPAPEFMLPDMPTPKSSPFIDLLERIQSCEDKDSERIEHSAHTPPLDIVTMSSVEQPLSKLCRSLNASVMVYFFKDLQLLQYLQALRDYFMFGNGDFYTNTMEALFQSHSTEYRPGGLLAVGLQKSLLSKQWPPSSIELSIALKDVLVSSSANAWSESGVHAAGKVPVGQYVSFSLRENVDGNNKWTIPQSLEAMDFLQLSYSPPYPLNIVITPTIIEKYNRIFSFLLRLLRVRVVVQNMHKLMQARRNRSSKSDAYLYIQPVRFQIAQFVDALHGYIFDAVIASNWKAYTNHLGAIAKEATAKSAAAGDHSDNYSDSDFLATSQLMMDLDTTRTYNEYLAELLLHQCMLKRKQQGILRIIETLLGSALALAAIISDFDAVCYDGREPTENEVRKLQRHCSSLQNRFHGQVKTLITILASLQKRDSGEIRFAVDQRRKSKVELFTEYYEKVSAEDGAVNCYERLLLRLDFNGYYQSVQ